MMREIGSEFHWHDQYDGSHLEWPLDSKFFATGRDCILSVLRSNNVKTIHVPDYFCPNVITWLQSTGLNVVLYLDGPHCLSPAINMSTIKETHAVLAVNFFGVKDGDFWKTFQTKRKKILLIEDHTHDPFSTWASSSRADFAFVSARKTLPIPDGAVLWSPQKHTLPNKPTVNDWTGSAYKLAAMTLKKDYLDSNIHQLKDTYRDFQLRGEQILDESINLSISPWSEFILKNGYPIIWRRQRGVNTKNLLELVGSQKTIKPLFSEWTNSSCPIGAVFIFANKFLRDDCRKHLIKNRIYPAVHWQAPLQSSRATRDFSERILTIPTDHRYRAADMTRISSIINNFEY
jgi:hypothetical protein